MNKILIINGPNLNLIGEREQSQYGSKDYAYLEEICKKLCDELSIDLKILFDILNFLSIIIHHR